MADHKLDLKALRQLAKTRRMKVSEAAREGGGAFVALAEIKRRSLLSAMYRHFPELPQSVENKLADLTAEEVASGKVEEIVKKAIAKASLDPKERERLIATLAEIGLADKVRAPLEVSPELEIDKVPGLTTELERATVAEITRIAGLNEASSKAVLGRAAGIGGLNEQRIATLVIERKLNKKDAMRLGVIAGMSQFLGGDTEVVERLGKARFRTLGGKIADLPDLLKVDTAELSKVMDPKLASSDPKAAAAAASALKTRVEQRFPAVGITARLALQGAEVLDKTIQTTRKVLAENPDALDAAPGTIKIGEAEAKSLRSLQATILSYPGMGLKELITKGSATSAAAKIQKTVSLYDRFAAQNSDRNFLHFDPTPGSEDISKFDFSGIPQAAHAGIISTAKARARSYAVGGDVGTASALVQGGFHSAMAIAQSNPDDIALWTGLSKDEAKIVYSSAKDMRASITNIIATLVDEMRWKVPGLLWGGWQFEDVTDGLKKLPGYEELFGDQSFCDCKHCDSVLGPAAYFVDLMTFVDENVTSKVFTGAKADHALKLQTRRPDLWTVPLTCDNTNDLVPTLEIINEILEIALARRADAGINVNDRAKVRAKVYEDVLPAAFNSFITPFDLRVASADRYVQDFNTDRTEIAGLICPDAGDESLNAAALKLSLPGYRMITTPRTQWADLQKLYRMNISHAGSTANPFDVQDIMAGMQISRADFGDLVASDFVTDSGAVHIRIVSQKRNADSVQNDIEKVTGMTNAALDRAHRLWRLKLALDWPVDTLDLALSRVGGALTDETIAQLVILRDVAKRFGLALDQAMALTETIPSIAVGGEEDSLIDRLFNGKNTGANATDFPAPLLRFVHPGLRDDASLPEVGPNAGNFVSQRLRLALGLTETELLDLILAFANPLGIDPEAVTEEGRGFLLTADKLALLYRHTLLADMMDLDCNELAMMIQIATGGAAVTNSVQLTMLLDYAKQTGSSPLTPTIAATLMDLAPDAIAEEVLIDPVSVVDAVLLDIETTEATHFAATIFAFIDGVSEDQSRAIVAANAALFETLDRDMLRLVQTIGLTPALNAPPDGFPAGVALADLQAALAPFNLRRLLPERLAANLGIGVDKLVALATFVAADLSAQAVIDGAAGGDRGALNTAIGRLARPLVALAHEAVTASRVSFVDSHRSLFDIVDPTVAFSRNAVIALGAYCEALIAAKQEDGYADALETVLLAHTPAAGFAGADPSLLATAAGTEAATVGILTAGATLPGGALVALHHLRQIVTFADDRKLGADALVLLASSDPAALGEGAESLKAALRLRLNDKEMFDSAVEAHEDALRGMRRDALVDHIVRNSAGRFYDAGDLYNYYLIDPEMEGCARTSLVVSAIGSLQSYVHRVLLDLEQDRRSPNAANHVYVSPSLIPRGEWEWRKNYRVWEANRKVFLWPENYMQPELRDNKTPLFEELEKTLLQQDLTEQTVLDAYAAYLKGFEEVASLRIAGAFHEHVWSDLTDILHVFGCTSDDPPIYYYWTVENLIFSKIYSNRRISYSARRKIDLAVGARDVSPIIFNNRLHLFWLDKSTAPYNTLEDGENKFKGYRHTLMVKYSALRLDGTWTPPQSLKLGRNSFMHTGGLLIEGRYHKKQNSSILVPYYSDVLIGHTEYQEGYTLTAPAWQRVYPTVFGGVLYLNIGAALFPFEVDMFERTALEPDNETEDALETSWHFSRNTIHVSPATGASRYVYDQLLQNNFTILDTASPNAMFDFVSTRDALRRNILGYSYPEVSIEWVMSNLNMSISDLGAAVAKVNDPEARVVVPLSAWWYTSALVQKDSDISFFSYSYDRDGRPYESRRLGTTVLGDLNRKLFYGGVDELLDKATQLGFAEKTHLVTSANFRTKVIGTTSKLDYTGPLGVYFREIFMYVPALLAAHQNARGNYAAAQAWYATIFDPTAEFDTGVDLAGMSEAERLQAERNRVWQYAEFQGVAPAKLRDILTDDAAQEAYRKDPFNPYAIARLRISAFQKNIVMRYVSNLLDWADSLFRQFQRETVDEAHILYDLARQILGPRPADVGDCGEGAVAPRNYQRIKPHMEKEQDFLIEVETLLIHRNHSASKDLSTTVKRNYIDIEFADMYAIDLRSKMESKLAPEIRYDSAFTPSAADRVAKRAAGGTEKMLADDKTVAKMKDIPTAPAAAAPLPQYQAEVMRFETACANDGTAGRQMQWNVVGNAYAEKANANAVGAKDRNWRDWMLINPDDFTFSVIRQVSPIFCVPRNKDLLELWDRVEDRLYKIRNCRNIDGERVALALFAPEIDPMALVRARAAGLSLGDILGATGGNLPPYRFTYLIAKAREYAGLVQGFGSKLQSAIERRDAEELATLRLTQAITMQKFVTKIREQEVKLANESLEELRRRKTAVEYRRDYLEQQISTDLLSWERTEQILTHTASVSYTLSALLTGTAGVLYLIPQLGSPFSMKYGGKELGDSGAKWSDVFSDTAKLCDVLSKSASLEARNQRRREGWSHQKENEKHELKQLEKRISAAEIRVVIAERALSNHKKEIEHQEDILDFYESKFSNQALYTWMASSLQTIYRQAFNSAYEMALLAERAYRFERPGDTAALLEPGYWDAAHAGLLSGEKLSVDLVAMEKRFLETNYRVLEITQPFSMLQLDPGALMGLREEGECEFTIPEFAFDLLYPGHYRRRIRSVRLTIACVTGPYVNVPATLTLTAAKMRLEPTLDGAAGLSDCLLRHTVQVATSTAQADAGVFDFSFGDPRYMPFEGAGAVESCWKVTLPKAFRPFNYASINDVIISVSYSAQLDGVLRERVESANSALEGALRKVLSETPLPRALSLRHEFSTAFHQLQTGVLGSEVMVSLDNRVLPLALRNDAVGIDRAFLLLKPAGELLATGTEISLNGVTLSGFTALPDFPNYVGANATAALVGGLVGDHIFSITNAGDLAPEGGGAGQALADGALEDLVLYVELTLA